MEDSIEFGIGFLAGRPNVCRIINSYYKDILNQIKLYKKKVNITIFILYDLEYQFSDRSYFYNILPEVYENIKIKYISPEDIEEEKKTLISKYGFSKKDIDLFIGKGYGKSRNSILYFALKNHINYLFFWDDDEYPLAIYKDINNKISWVKQNNILNTIEALEDCDVTNGFRCGFMAPVPNVKNINQVVFQEFLEAINTDGIPDDYFENNKKNEEGITFADREVALKHIEPKIWEGTLYASTLGINLNNIHNIPAFYNPPDARGEDTFFNLALKQKAKAKVLKTNSYHFHDTFLKYIDVMDGNYSSKLKKISLKEGKEIEKRFYYTILGWIKYKPLYIYLTEKEEYKQIINKCKETLFQTTSVVNELFSKYNFSNLIEELNYYDKNVENHYQEYLKTNEIWNNIKLTMLSLNK